MHSIVGAPRVPPCAGYADGLSPSAARPYVTFNCAAVPGELFEGQLFAHRRGAFTGATADQLGVVRAADGGTLFLDEIAELPLELQPKLLRFLENREVAISARSGRCRWTCASSPRPIAITSTWCARARSVRTSSSGSKSSASASLRCGIAPRTSWRWRGTSRER